MMTKTHQLASGILETQTTQLLLLTISITLVSCPSIGACPTQAWLSAAEKITELSSLTSRLESRCLSSQLKPSTERWNGPTTCMEKCAQWMKMETPVFCHLNLKDFTKIQIKHLQHLTFFNPQMLPMFQLGFSQNVEQDLALATNWLRLIKSQRELFVSTIKEQISLWPKGWATSTTNFKPYLQLKSVK